MCKNKGKKLTAACTSLYTESNGNQYTIYHNNCVGGNATIPMKLFLLHFVKSLYVTKYNAYICLY